MFVLNCNDIIPEEARSCLAKTVIICSPKCKIITLNLLYNYFEMCPPDTHWDPNPYFFNHWPLQK